MTSVLMVLTGAKVWTMKKEDYHGRPVNNAEGYRLTSYGD